MKAASTKLGAGPLVDDPRKVRLGRAEDVLEVETEFTPAELEKFRVEPMGWIIPFEILNLGGFRVRRLAMREPEPDEDRR